AGITAVFSGAISMAAGAYLAARAEKDIVEHERDAASKLAESEPYLAQEGILEALAKEGLTREQAYRVVGVLSSSQRVLLSTFHEKVFGLGAVELNQPLKGAAVMAASFIAGGTIPLVPYILLPGTIALAVSAAFAAATLFGVGAFKGRLAGQKPLRSGASFFVVAVGAAAVGYLIGLAADALVPGAGVGAG
ncbi:MAG TPA: VIT1/CCC1 transporter family protein, partial [bacterium]|nr:VIT1/CCC1 transporter family protein [bacterium]